jgi:SAM-dependent methyltransferase
MLRRGYPAPGRGKRAGNAARTDRVLSDMTTTTGYVLGSAERERERLVGQANQLGRISDRMLREAGLERGLRVLEAGTGMGDVAMLASAIVGPEGSVTGIERDPAMIEAAEKRFSDAGIGNVRLIQGDVCEVDPGGEPFDAAIGRLILMHCPDPAAVVRNCVRHVRKGGVVAFQDYDMGYMPSHPPVPLWDEGAGRIRRTFEALGVETRMGLRLRPLLLEAGLPDPQVRSEPPIGGGESFGGYEMAAETTRTLLPHIERLGLGTAEEVDVDTLAARLREAVCEANAVVATPAIVTAWARVPA